MGPLELKVLILRRGVRQIDVASVLGMSDGQLSKILTGAKPFPEGFEERFLAAVETVANEKASRLMGEPVGAGK